MLPKTPPALAGVDVPSKGLSVRLIFFPVICIPPQATAYVAADKNCFALSEITHEVRPDNHVSRNGTPMPAGFA